MHWGLGINDAKDWVEAAAKYQPAQTKNFGDGKACQTVFETDSKDKTVRTVRMNISWIREIEEAIKGLNFVIFE